MDDEVYELGSRIGYGHMMYVARDGWAQHLKSTLGFSGGEFAIGPCVAGTVECVCKEVRCSGICDYCRGCGWLTKAVKELIVTGNTQ